MSKPQKIEKQLSTISERVKMIDMHPKEPLVLCSMYNGQVTLWNYETKALVKCFEVSDVPVRCAKFIARLQSFACGADDMNIRIYNYNTMEKTKTFVAHDDYLRSIAVHDQLPIMLTSSDDHRIKAWDWSRDWACTMIFQHHMGYVMAVAFNPKDAMTFASASLDLSIKVWNLSAPDPNFSLLGHEDGVNCVEYYPKGDKPYLVSGSDDHTVRVWDYQTRACIQVLTHHSHNVTTVFFHPDVPVLLTGGEDEIISLISTQTWRQEQTLSYGMQRAWTIAARPNTNAVAVGYDRGMVVLKVGSDEPVMAMDGNGRIYHSVANEVHRTDIKNLPEDVADAEPIRLASKELGTGESAPMRIAVGPSGQYVCVLTDTEFTIFSSLAWRPKSFGACTAFAWGNTSGSYAIIEGGNTLKTFKSFKPAETLRLPEAADRLFAGPLLGIRSGGAVSFLDWDTLTVVRRIDCVPTTVSWSDSNELVAIVLENAFVVLRYNADEVAAHLRTAGEEGIESAFDIVEQVEERVRQASWVGDCLCFVNSSDRLNYYIGGEITTIAVVNRQTHLLGFFAKENRLFLMDRERNVTSYVLHVSVIEYKTAIVREDFDTAAGILPRVPAASRDKVAQFLQSRGHLELALEVSTEDDHRFDLAVNLGRIETAVDICTRIPTAARWKQIGDLALEQGLFDIATAALKECKDINGLLMLYTSTGDVDGIRGLLKMAREAGKTNVAFTCAHFLGDHAACVDLLILTQRVADAAFYARTYLPSRVDEVVRRWKNTVAALPRTRDAIADPTGFPNLFPNIRPTAPATVEKPTFETETPSEDADEIESVADPASPPPTPQVGFSRGAAASPGLLSPQQPAVPTTTPVTTLRPNVLGASATEGTPSSARSPPQPRVPEPTPATVFRKDPAAADLPESTPLVVKATAAVAAAAPSADVRLDYSPDKGTPQHKDPAAPAPAAPSPAAPAVKDELDDLFEGNPEAGDAAAAPVGDDDMMDGLDDEDWN